jgi:hypothetical protein
MIQDMDDWVSGPGALQDGIDRFHHKGADGTVVLDLRRFLVIIRERGRAGLGDDYTRART